MIRMTSLKVMLLFVCLGYSASLYGVDTPSNKELKIGITQELGSINPVIMTMSASSYIGQMVSRRLMVVDANWKWTCSMCTKVPSITNGLAKIIVEKGKRKLLVNWQLKPDHHWADGKPVTAADFKLAWEIGVSPNVSVSEKDQYSKIESFLIDPMDPLKFKTKFSSAVYDFYQLPYQAVPSHLEGPIWQKSKDKPDEYEKQSLYTVDAQNPGLYNGPYFIKEIKSGSHVELRRNPFFGSSIAHIEKILIRLIPNTQALEASLLSGKIDMISELGMTFDQAQVFEKRISKSTSLKKRYGVRYRNGLIYEHIDLNLRNPILKDVKVRRALLHAVDRDKLCFVLFNGKQKKAISNIHPLDPYYSQEIVRYNHDPKKAMKLLGEAGWTIKKDGYRFKKDKKLSLTLMTTAGDKTRERIQRFLKKEWGKVGVAIDIRNEPPKVFFSETIRRAKFSGMAMFAWMSSPDDPPRSTLHSSEIPSAENGWSGQNATGWKNRSADALLDSIKSEFSFAKRKKMMAKLQDLYKNDLPVIPLFLRAQIAIIPAKMKNFELTGHQYNSSYSVNLWSFE